VFGFVGAFEEAFLAEIVIGALDAFVPYAFDWMLLAAIAGHTTVGRCAGVEFFFHGELLVVDPVEGVVDHFLPIAIILVHRDVDMALIVQIR
jgi:hypothetical protein